MKDKGKILNRARGKNKQLLTYREKIIQMIVDCSSETTEAQGSEAEFSKCSKKRPVNPESCHLAEISFRNKEGIKIFSDEREN